MKRYSIKDQVSMFMPLQELKAEPNTVAELLNLYKSDGFVPQNVQQAEAPQQMPVSRPSFYNPANNIAISFLNERLDVVKSYLGTEEPPIDLIEFSENVNTYIDRFFTYQKYMGSRLSLVSEFILLDLDFEKIRQKFVSYPELFDADSVGEWSCRFNSKKRYEIQGTNETVNCILQLNLTDGEFFQNNTVERFSGLGILFDINTNDRRNIQRFDLASLQDFCEKATTIQSQLLEEIMESGR